MFANKFWKPFSNLHVSFQIRIFVASNGNGIFSVLGPNLMSYLKSNSSK